ncbi:MAG: type V CRISPR-associated protein Cas4 [Opitutae bacterium]|nr:type V CRISPR-associated protein Cas4 [Opitutae bacterium]
MITQINDFVFCPRSIYFHDIYRCTTDEEFYHQTPQKIGQYSHKAIDENKYSSRQDVITGLTVYSRKYNLVGRIDILDMRENLLTERKYSVTAIYDGFKYQLYAQALALGEMGYEVKRMQIHSAKDNRNYEIAMPDQAEIQKFESVIAAMNSFSMTQPFTQNPKKCEHCIYNPLCDVYSPA